MIKKQLTTLIALVICCLSFAQKTPNNKKLIQELSDNACKCVDSIEIFNRDKSDIIKDVHGCIDKHTGALQLGSLLSTVDELSKNAPEVDGKKEVNINLDLDKDSKQYIESYNEIERYMMKNCSSLKDAVNVAESKIEKVTKNDEALDFYHKAIEASKKEDWVEAIKNYERAVKKDPSYTYAWDNLGLCYRRIGEYDKALEAYKKSLEADPAGKMPLQNIPVIYIYKKEYQKAIDAYLKLDKVHPGDPEVYYGIGNVYFSGIKDDEKALDYICKAYRIYNDQKSPYRTDAESILSLIYKNMKEKGQTEKFKEILKKNNIDIK
ncbi:tetratricopeptide repeat protein [Chryseobacterium chendengshani]|uniref:tetratricopeptide repeat protein n=1 Tax=Chryseobacterium sp. LJ668 TaxID=2864040 RepID=UPI001C6909EC|nr:tetratricopeptide repeat protein [Chryseobacterium sp. LJ668]MBW8522991.1 tetratricopeptide repeat protein [Chryseobacterium sp. LJ668]QYK16520.1 tetratricopeptide repeat protein [Chryseobacterium sp. LJ668]